MKFKHKITVNVSDPKDNKATLFRAADMWLPSRIVKFLFGEYRQIYLLDPGQSIESVDVKEVNKGGESDGKNERTR